MPSNSKPPLTLPAILEWADAHHQQHGSYPDAWSGSVIGQPGEKWYNIDHCLRLGFRGLPGNDSLASVLIRERTYRDKFHQPPLTLAAILSWAEAHRQRTWKWPNLNSGVRFEIFAALHFVERDEDRPTQEALAERFGISRDQVRYAVEQVRKRFDRLLRQEIREQVGSDVDVEEEIQSLFAT
jgi:hypothetical protein